MYKQFFLDKEGRQDNGPKQEWQGGCLGRLSTIGNIHRLNLNQAHLVIRSNISNQAQPTNLTGFLLQSILLLSVWWVVVKLVR